MTLEFTKEILLAGDLTVFFIFYHYGVALKDRMSTTQIVVQYENGYFDDFIEEEFI